MPVEGYVMLQHQGRYEIYNVNLYHELKEGDPIEVEAGGEWLEVRVGHDFEKDYPQGEKISFIPRKFMPVLWRAMTVLNAD